jgi:hypothetical protein
MTRTEAISQLVEAELAQLTPERRLDLLEDYWGLEAGNPEYEALPEPLRLEIMQREKPADPSSSFYDPLLRIALRHSFLGVINTYLEQRLAALGRPEVVHGAVEMLGACPCCGYRTLDEPGGMYDICKVCFWEDDGTTDPERGGGPNRMTLGEARQNFQRIGAMSERVRRYVLPDGTQRYPRSAG